MAFRKKSFGKKRGFNRSFKRAKRYSTSKNKRYGAYRTSRGGIRL